MLSTFDRTKSASQLWIHITLLGGIYWVSWTLKNVKDTIIQERFVFAHFLPNAEPDGAYNNDDDNDIMLICPTSDLREMPNELDTNFQSAIPTENKIRLWKDLSNITIQMKHKIATTMLLTTVMVWLQLFYLY